MQIKKAVLTAAGLDQHELPLQTLIDRDGHSKSSLRVLVEEILATGVEEICVVVAPGSRDAFASAAGPALDHLWFVAQEQPRGYGHALRAAAEFVGDDPFLHLVSDHLPVHRGERRCAAQLVEVATREQCAVSGVQPTREHLLPHYGAVGGRPVAGQDGLYEVENVLEKPTPTDAEQHLIVPGLRSGHYLCFFGMHVLTPAVMELLEARDRDSPPDATLHLSPALADLARQERYLALEVEGHRYDLGRRYGLLHAQLALALEGEEREEVLASLLELLASRLRGGRGTR